MSQTFTSFTDHALAEGHAVGDDHRDTSDGSGWLSAALIIGMPMVFWLLVLEFGAWAVGMNFSMTSRMVIAALLGSFLTLLWGAIRQVR
ncbi:MAG: hypothetical protein KDJ36_05380 [Hyphomicrobiaceae bacterium]|nr:hypothetical protein [Hyphomicrobiaceae bacterium]